MNPTAKLLLEFVYIMDKLVVDQLINSLRDHAPHMKLLEQKWACLEEIVDLANNFMIARAIEIDHSITSK